MYLSFSTSQSIKIYYLKKNSLSISVKNFLYLAFFRYGNFEMEERGGEEGGGGGGGGGGQKKYFKLNVHTSTFCPEDLIIRALVL
jgi:hypothetical protein